MLFPPFLPANVMTLVQGDPGCGKSYFTGYLTARVTRGLQFFGDKPNKTGPQNVLFLNGEDDPGVTTRPRLESLGADCERVFIEKLPSLTDENPDNWKTLQIDNIETMKEYLEYSKAKLVIIDPIQAFIPNTDINRANEIRSALGPIDALAKKMKVTIVAVQHFNKSSQESALYRGLGSIDFVGMARSVIQIYKSPRDSSERGVFNIKNNLGPAGSAFTIYIQDDGTFGIGDKMEMEPHQYLKENTQGGRLKQAKEILRVEIEKGPIEGARFAILAKQNDISKSTFERARGLLNLQFKKFSSGETLWSLPAEEPVGHEVNEAWGLKSKAEESPEDEAPSDDAHYLEYDFDVPF